MGKSIHQSHRVAPATAFSARQNQNGASSWQRVVPLVPCNSSYQQNPLRIGNPNWLSVDKFTVMSKTMATAFNAKPNWPQLCAFAMGQGARTIELGNNRDFRPIVSIIPIRHRDPELEAFCHQPDCLVRTTGFVPSKHKSSSIA